MAAQRSDHAGKKRRRATTGTSKAARQAARSAAAAKKRTAPERDAAASGPKKKRAREPGKQGAGAQKTAAGRKSATRQKTVDGQKAAAGRKGAARQKTAGGQKGVGKAGKVLLPRPPAMWFQVSIFLALAAGAGMLFYGIARVAYALATTDMYWVAAAMIISGMLAGVVATGLVALLALYSFHPLSHPLKRLNKRYMGFGVVGTGMLAIVVAAAVPALLMLIIPGLIPAAAVLFMVVRPRISAIAVARGHPAPLSFVERRTKAMEDARRDRDEHRKRTEAYEALKRRRLGGG